MSAPLTLSWLSGVDREESGRDKGARDFPETPALTHRVSPPLLIQYLSVDFHRMASCSYLEQTQVLGSPLDLSVNVHSVRMGWGVSQVARVVKNLPANAEDIRDSDLIPGVRKNPWRRAWQSIPVFLPGKPHRQRSLGGYSSCGHKRLRYAEAA